MARARPATTTTSADRRLDPLHVDLLVIAAAALGVQLVFSYRHDWPAHLLGGAGAMLILAAAAPRALRPATALAGFAVVVGLAWATELRVFGPLDLVDVSFTLAGAVLAFQAAARIGAAGSAGRWQAVRWGAALIVVGLAFRYSTSIGPA